MGCYPFCATSHDLFHHFSMSDMETYGNASALLVLCEGNQIKIKLNQIFYCYPNHVQVWQNSTSNTAIHMKVNHRFDANVILDITERLCIPCHVIEDEEHFVTDCVNNREIRKSFFEKISLREPGFPNWNNREKFVILMSCEDPQILSWFSKFLYHSFYTRNLRTSLRV